MENLNEKFKDIKIEANTLIKLEKRLNDIRKNLADLRTYKLDSEYYLLLDNLYEAKLRCLADYLWSLPKDYKHFDMETYLQNDSSKYDNEPKDVCEVLKQCNSAACAVGHGPVLFPLIVDMENPWTEYVRVVFGIVEFSKAWEWMFGMDWRDFDNTPHGAAKRIYYYLENDISDWDGYINEEALDLYKDTKIK